MTVIALGSDHAGFDLKEALKSSLEEKGYDVLDKGCFTTKPCDYPDFAQKVAESVSEGIASCGILVCGTGIGMSIAANKCDRIRAALCRNEYEAQMSRNHNDANVICIGARIIQKEVALRIVDKFLRSEFEGGRHKRRVEKLMNTKNATSEP